MRFCAWEHFHPIDQADLRFVVYHLFDRLDD